MKREHLPWLLASVTLLFHAVANPHYGFFRDELYFIICGRHPAFGYVDQPPLTPLLAAGSQIFGASLFLLRLIPALCAAATVYVTCLLVREMRGSAFAQVLASIAVLLAPVLAAFGEKAGPDMLEMPLWPLAALFVLRIVNGESPKWWLGAGIALGVAFESKYSVVFFAVALLAGLLLTPQRRILASKWFAAGVAATVLIALPNALWQLHYRLPMLELLRNGQLGKNIMLSPVAFIASQFELLNPVLSLIWLAGLAWLLLKEPLRWLGYAFVALMALMIAMHAKDYYPASVYPILFAAGARAIEAWTARIPAMRPAIACVAFVCGMVLIPFVEPVLPTQTFIAYQRALHLTPSTSEHHQMRELPQDWADMHGWPELAARVGAIYDSLPAADRVQAVVVAADYGQAAAIEFFNPHVPVVSGHNQYWLWGPRGYTGSVIIDISGGRCGQDRPKALFGDVRPVGTFTAPYIMAYEERPMTICRKPVRGMSLQALWPDLKDYE